MAASTIMAAIQESFYHSILGHWLMIFLLEVRLQRLGAASVEQLQLP
jgi:hypothetical protein